MRAFEKLISNLSPPPPQASRAETAFTEVGKVVDAASQCSKPSQADYEKFLKPIIEVVTVSQKTDNRSPLFNHQQAFAEFIQSMNFLMVPTPG